MTSAPHYSKPKCPTDEYLSLCTRGMELEEKGLYRRAAELWRNAITIPGLTQTERNLCASHASSCSGKMKYNARPEE